MTLTLESLIVYGVIGLISGFLASILIKSEKMGLLGLLIIGIIGAFFGAWLFEYFNISLDLGNKWVNKIIISTIGATIVLFIYNLLFNRKK